MKRKLWFRWISIFFVILVAGCREITVTTHVKRDGSCERIVTVRADSSDILNGRFPVPRDSTWTITQGRAETGDKKYEYQAVKHFSRPEAMNAFFDAEPDSLILHTETDLKRRFGWFITLYRYEEIYRAYNPFRHIPLSEVMTKDEMKILTSDKDSSEIKDKYNEWEQKNILEEFLQQFIKAAGKTDDPSLQKDVILSRRDDLYHALFGQEEEHGDEVDQMMAALEKVYKTPSVRLLRPEVEDIIHDIDRKIEFMGSVDSDSYTNTVVMPGIIMDTNADQVAGNGVTWKISPKAFVDMDYRMWVESRTVNRWAIVVTGLIIFIPAVWVIVRVIRKKSKS